MWYFLTIWFHINVIILYKIIKLKFVRGEINKTQHHKIKSLLFVKNNKLSKKRILLRCSKF
jgi:hypothetical protein